MQALLVAALLAFMLFTKCFMIVANPHTTSPHLYIKFKLIDNRNFNPTPISDASWCLC